MNRTILLAAAIFGTVTGFGEMPEGVVNAMTWGAETKLTFRVVDSTGNTVSNAAMNVYCSYDYTNKKKRIKAKTDENGQVIIEARSRGKFTWFAEKSGHYNSNGDYSFHVPGETRVRDGRWLPWNPIVEIILKEKRNPTPMFLISTPPQLQLPRGDKVGFDFDEADLVAPYGKGKRADILFIFDSQTPAGSRYATTNQIQILAVNTKEGFITFSKDMQSQLKSVYSSPDNGFKSVLEFRMKRDQDKLFIVYENTLPKNPDDQNKEYIVFRIRVETDEDGNIIHSRYGKIYSIDYGDHDVNSEVKTGFVRLSYFLNPNDNDPNLEFDGRTNLSNPTWRSPSSDL